MGYVYEERLCRICKGYDRPYKWTPRGGYSQMFQTGPRHYAHGRCLIDKFGLKGAYEKLYYNNVSHQTSLRRSARHPVTKGGKHPLVKKFEATR